MFMFSYACNSVSLCLEGVKWEAGSCMVMGLRFEEDEGPSLETSIFPLLFHVVGEP